MISLKLETFDLKETLTCGQCFRWQAISDQDWIGVAAGRVLRISQSGEELTLSCDQQDFDEYWHDYFDLSRDYGQMKSELLRRAPDLAEAVAFGRGIRLLNQEPFEMLITYILSANNHIPRITELVKRLSNTYGKPIDHPWDDLVGPLYAFPDPQTLAQADVTALRELGVGYRDKYIHESAMRALERPGLLEGLKNLPYQEAKAELMAFSGVGAKVADCILLFSARHYSAFPVDTWIKKTLARRYGLPENKPKQIERFVAETFWDLGGFANQYLFFYERAMEK